MSQEGNPQRHCDATLRRVALEARGAPCSPTIISHAAQAPQRRKRDLGPRNTLGALERTPGDSGQPQSQLPQKEGLPGTLSPPRNPAGGPRGSPRSARRRPLRPAPVAAAKTRRRHPARPRASAPPCESHWACSAPAGSGCCRWGAPHSRPPAAQPASLPGAGGHSLPAVGAPGHRARGVEPATARRLAMARGARRPPEWRGGVRLAGAPGQQGRGGEGGREPGTGWAARSLRPLGPRNFRALRLAEPREEASCRRRREVPVASSCGS